MPLKNPGRLTLSTDIPAFPPWWGGESPTQYPNEPEGGSEWTTVDFSAEPYSMEGYEGATAYAIAEAMGFTPDLVDWLPNAVFENAFTPGAKDFDFHMAQVSITPERAQAVTFSDPYFQANQALLAMSDNAITSATTIADLQGYKLGAGRNTTSFQLIEDVIQPTVEPSVLRSNADGRRALENGQIDALIVDLSTAFFMRDAQIEGDSTVVGQFSSELQADPVGAVLELNSPFVACLNAAIAEITANGTLQTIYDTWIVTDQAVPFFE
jgi:polar amino acid transport system substrate-binding protein